MTKETVYQLRAVEALRAGVPSRDVVRFFPPHQNDVENRWHTALESARNSVAQGILLEGDFGTGKSHWIERLRHLALEANFVCSTIVLNKETPLHDMSKLLRAAIESAVSPRRSGPALSEIAHTYNADKVPGYADLFQWADAKERDPRLLQSLMLFEKSRDTDVRERVIDEWMGYPMLAGEMKKALTDIGEKRVRVAKARRDSAERFEFLARFFQSAGYSGWALLLDETEMTSKYSLRQRGRSYAHLARFLGATEGIHGLACAATITKDYAGQVLYGRKNDASLLPRRLEDSPDEFLVAAAIAGMRTIEKNGIDLRPPSRDSVDDLFEKAREFYSVAYQWPAPALPSRLEFSSTTSLRQHLRSWINTWDLLRLYAHQSQTVTEIIAISYEEDIALQDEENDS